MKKMIYNHTVKPLNLVKLETSKSISYILWIKMKKKLGVPLEYKRELGGGEDHLIVSLLWCGGYNS